VTDLRWLVRALACAWLSAACANPPPPAPPSGNGFDVVVDTESMTRPEPQRQAWLVYALGGIAAYKTHLDLRKNKAGDDFAIELSARSELATFWRDERSKGASADDYLDRLVALDDAGHLAEHVLVSLAKPGWTIPADELGRIDFAALRELAREPIAAPTYAIAKPRSAPLYAEPPGVGLPDPVPLAPPGSGCVQSMPTLRRAMSAWKSEVEQLDGAPTAADDRAGFIAVLSDLPPDAPQRARGATWVALRPYWLSFLAGFCSVELERIPDAERWLEQAVAMAPRHATARMELAHVLVMRRKFERADAILDDALAHSQDRCELARAWRRRGYIRFEQRRLDEAESAYRRSLEFDPESSIARSELDLLQREIANHGGTPQSYLPPPSNPTGVTTCPPS
jgi:tetratricopeptide (TPR) repeat protein